MAEQQTGTGAGATTTGVAAITDFLDGEGVDFEVVEHEPTMTAEAEAHATHHSTGEVAKTVVLHDGGACTLAIVPASHRVDMHKLREVLGASRHLRLAEEAEIAAEFPTLEVGATPPVGPILTGAEIVDARLLQHDHVLCAAGDHRHSVVLDPRDVVKLADAAVADICED